MAIKAVYENGVFKPLENVPIKEGTEVDVYPRTGKDNGARRRPWKSVTESPAYGILADVEGIGDGVDYVTRMRKLRREPESR